MGCISSKAVTRSLSFQEELNCGFQNTSKSIKSIPVFEKLLSSRVANDQFIALVCSSHFTNKLSNTNPKRALETAQIPKVKADAENSLQPQDAVGMNDSRRLSRSKSCKMYTELYEQDPQIEGLSENKLDWRDKNITGSRSFHTVEEYDALLERIYMSSTRGKESSQGNDSSLDENVQKSKSMEEDHNEGSVTDTLKNNSIITEGLSEHESSSSSSSSTKKSENFGKFVQEESVRETGWKRKAVAQGLKSLDVSPVEFPAIARLRQPLHVEGQVYSPGTYVTPKFGSYIKENLVRKEDGNDSVFSPEVVAAFEECMKQLEAEEESILSYIDGYLHSNKEMENQQDCKMQILYE